jgi:hypothetical protein
MATCINFVDGSYRQGSVQPFLPPGLGKNLDSAGGPGWAERCPRSRLRLLCYRCA